MQIFDLACQPAGKIENILYPWGTNLLDPCQQNIRYHKRVGFVSWSEDGRSLASGTLGGELTLWDSGGKKQQSLPRCSSQLSGIYWHQGALISVGRDGSIHSSARNEALGKSKFESVFRSCCLGGLLAVGDDKEVQVLDLNSNKFVAAFAVPPGPLMLSAQAKYLSVQADRSCILFDPATGKRVHKVEAAAGVTDQAFTPEGTLLAATGIGLREFSVPDGKALKEYHGGEYLWIRISPDGRSVLASKDNSGDYLRKQITVLYPDRSSPDDAVQVPGFSQDFLSGNRLLQFQDTPPLARILSPEGAKIRSIALPTEVRPLLCIPKPVNFALNPARTLLAVGLPNGSVRVYAVDK